MKRSPLKRGTSQLKRTPLKKSGTTKAKKVERQKAFYSSAVWKRLRKEALGRAGNRCEFVEQSSKWDYDADPSYLISWSLHRCIATQHLQVHHRSNLRFGGDELPEDLQVLCRAHHELVEHRDHPHRQRSR